MGNGDFKTKLERKAFDKAIEDSLWIFRQDAMDGTGIDLGDGESFILHDGMARVWCVQTVVKNVVGSAKLVTSVYADGSRVPGTAFFGAWLFHQLRTKSVKAQDTVVRVVYLGHTAENKGEGGAHHIHCALFRTHQARNQAWNNLILKHKQNLNDAVGFHELAVYPSANITTTQRTITGVEAAYNNLTEPGATEAAVRLYSESDLGSITEAAVVRTVKDDSLAAEGSSGTSATESSTASASENEVEEKLMNPIEKDEGDETPIQDRSKEAETGPQALKDPKQTTFTANFFVSLAQDNRTRIGAFSAWLEGDHEPLGPSPNSLKSMSRRSSRWWSVPARAGERAKELPEVCGSGVGHSRDELGWDKAAECGSEAYEEGAKSEGCERGDCDDDGGQATEDNLGKDRR
ncbi:unnamed protein product [Rhizoctonia solani]|uniref:Uncharacterized protein n=1 Tax=Rhizoctonia solani TaxID=456999 RepID=A0A8H2X3Y0_9AGAM|nr:unnamed protein product [Rhizoctonia solani]